MNRRGALTLGAVIVLGPVTGARGDDLSGLAAAPPSAGLLPSWGEVLPRLPENWSDLPVRLKLSETVGYNNNVLANTGSVVATGASAVGDFQSLTTYGASVKHYWSSQQLFADATYGMTRYLRNARLDNYSYFLDAGVNWAYTSRCSGTLVATDSVSSSATGAISSVPQSPSTTGQPTSVNPITGQPTTVNPVTGVPTSPTTQPGSFSTLGQQVGAGSINIVTSTSFSETGNCRVSGDYSANLNSAVTQTTNSTVANKPNNNRTVSVSAGVSYNVAATDSLIALLSISSTDYTSRSAALNSTGLVNNVTQDQFNVTYTKTLSPNLTVVASIGASGVSNGSFNLAVPSGIVPQYSASATWTPTSKVSLSASVGQTVSPPTSVIGNAQRTESASLSLGYQLSPKVSFSANVASSMAKSAFTQLSSGAVVSGAAANALSSQKTYSAGASLAYRITPFLGASLSYQYSRSVQANQTIPQSLVLLNVNYNPY